MSLCFGDGTEWQYNRKQREIPRLLRSRGSLRHSLASLVPVLTPPRFPQKTGAFIPTRVAWLDSLCGRE